MSEQAVRMSEVGGVEVMTLNSISLEAPGAGQVRVRQHACGLNYIDIYHRSGLYPLPLPSGLGLEAAGVVETVGEGVTHLKVGDRVAYVSAATGAYATARVLAARELVRLPDALSFEQGAAMMLKGLTVQYLLRRTQPQGGLQAGDAVLFHAAAGGVGLMACQWAKAMGLRLIGTASTEAKCALALEHGASEMILYSQQDFAQRVRELTDGRGVKVVYDSVGASTWEGSLRSLAPLGLLVSFGNASGPVPPVALGQLAAAGSVYLTRPTLFTHLNQAGAAAAMAEDLFSMVLSGSVRIPMGQRYALADVQQAHRDMEARATTGSGVLLV
ncbi:quinone oxidoreductase family protein [Roseateles sp. BYS180W]|uniref:Quinone oxidoreductase family protein n=1 Tax=Roseateles rivi TaxID=3299028 RepID=A0ABW7FZM3_9BURK